MSAFVSRIGVTAELPARVESKTRVQIMPWGRFESNSPSGSKIPTLVDRETVAILNRAFDQAYRNRRIDMQFDYEHQSEGGRFARADGLSPASGWVRHDSAGFIGVENDGVYVDVEWTPKALNLVANREYRYLSFAGLIDAFDGRVMAVNAVALTNQPQTSVRPVANSVINASMAGSGSEIMDRESIIDKAAKEWDASKEIQKAAGRTAWINEALREAKLPRATDDEIKAADERLADSDGERAAVANRAINEFNQDSSLVRITNRAAYVDDALRTKGLMRLTASERHRLS